MNKISNFNKFQDTINWVSPMIQHDCSVFFCKQFQVIQVHFKQRFVQLLAEFWCWNTGGSLVFHAFICPCPFVGAHNIWTVSSYGANCLFIDPTFVHPSCRCGSQWVIGIVTTETSLLARVFRTALKLVDTNGYVMIPNMSRNTIVWFGSQIQCTVLTIWWKLWMILPDDCHWTSCMVLLLVDCHNLSCNFAISQSSLICFGSNIFLLFDNSFTTDDSI